MCTKWNVLRNQNAQKSKGRAQHNICTTTISRSTLRIIKEYENQLQLGSSVPVRGLPFFSGPTLDTTATGASPGSSPSSPTSPPHLFLPQFNYLSRFVALLPISRVISPIDQSLTPTTLYPVTFLSHSFLCTAPLMNKL